MAYASRSILFLFLAVLECSAQLDTAKWYAPDNNLGGAGYCWNASQVTELGGYMYETAIWSPNTCYGTPVNYKSGAVVSTPFYFQYGTVKVRAKLSPSGAHSAIWMWGGAAGTRGYPPICVASIKTGADFCSGPDIAYEIDIAEVIPGLLTVNKVRTGLITWVSAAATPRGVNDYDPGADVSADFYVFELTWTPTQLIYKLNGVTTSNFTYSVPVPMFLRMDQEIDGNAPQLPSGSYPISSVFSYAVVYCTTDTTYPAGCTPGQPIFSDNFTAGTGAVLSQGVTKGAVVQ